jgi:YD repeat-containing protein
MSCPSRSTFWPTSIPPEVGITHAAATRPAVPSRSAVCVDASDDVGLSSVMLEIDNQSRTLDSQRCHSWTPPEAGLIPALATAVDPSGLSSQVTSSLSVVDCNDEERPVVTLISPGPDALLLEPEPLIVSIDDNTPSTMTWTATLRAGLDGDPEELAAGSGAVDQGEIAVIDPTRLVEGEYWISILGNDGAQTGGIEFRVNVGNGFKPGRMVSANVDASLPLAGIPLTIGRSYDSLEAGQPGATPGDLGPGWRLSLSGSVQDSAAEGTGPLAELLAEPFNASTRVTVVKPNGERVGFTFVREPKPFPATFDFEPVFVPDPGVRDELRAVDGVTGGFGIVPYNPSIYELETPDKVVYVFSESDGLIQVRDALGGTLEISENGIQSSRGTRVDYVRDGQGRITEIVLPPAEPGAEQGRILYSYDAIGNLRTVTDLTGGVTTFEYADSAYPHHLTRVIDPRGEVMSRQVFDDDGRMVAQCPADGNAATLEGCITYAFDVAGGIQTIFDARGFRSDLVHDEQGQLLLRRDWVDDINFIEQQWTYDETGRVLEYRDGDGGVETNEYDEQGNRIRRVMPDGQAWTWEYGACREQWIRQCDPLDNCHQREFNSSCRQTRVIDPLNFVTEYEYNGAGLLARVTDELGQDREFVYDPFGQVTLITDASGQTTRFEYNGLGQITRSTDRNGQVREYVYDDTQRLVEERLPGVGSVAAYEYNATGLLTRMATTDSIVETQYWPTGSVRRVDHRAPGAPDWWVEYDYDGNGNIEVVRDSAGGLTEYLYDGINRLVSIRQSGTNVLPKRIDIQSTANGLPLMMQRFGDLDAQLPGPVTEYSYSCLSCPGRLTAIEHRQPSGAVIQRIDYQRDAAQRMIGMQDDDGLHQFVLDGRGWMIESSHPPASGIASGPTLWDATGNWLSKPGQAGSAPAVLCPGTGWTPLARGWCLRLQLHERRAMAGARASLRWIHSGADPFAVPSNRSR